MGAVGVPPDDSGRALTARDRGLAVLEAVQDTCQTATLSAAFEATCRMAAKSPTRPDSSLGSNRYTVAQWAFAMGSSSSNGSIKRRSPSIVGKSLNSHDAGIESAQIRA